VYIGGTSFCDLKAIGISTKKLGRAVCAFANTAGGDLYVGIAETDLLGAKVRTWHGFHNQEAANGHLQSLEALFPLGAEYSYEFLSCPGSLGLVLHVAVQRTPQIARAHDKKIWVRRGAQNLEVKGVEALRRPELDKGIVSYEKQPVSVDLTVLTESENLAEFIKQVVPMQTPPVFVRKQAAGAQQPTGGGGTSALRRRTASCGAKIGCKTLSLQDDRRCRDS